MGLTKWDASKDWVCAIEPHTYPGPYPGQSASPHTLACLSHDPSRSTLYSGTIISSQWPRWV